MKGDVVVRLRIRFHPFAVAVLFLAFAANGQAEPVYVSRIFSDFGTVDLTTGVYTKIATTSAQLDALAFAPSGTLYGLGSDNHLYTVNPATGGLTDVGSTGTFFGLNSLAARSDGTVFGEDPFGTLYTLDPATGKGTLVGGSGVFGLHSTGILAFGPGDTLFSDNSFFGDFLTTQNQSTGAETQVGSNALNINFPGGLFFDNGQAFGFGFFGDINSINTGTGTSSPTGVSISGGFGQVLGAAAQPQEAPVAVPEPSGFMLFLVALGVPGAAWLLRRRKKLTAQCAGH
jgi:hypothetical protein